MIKVYHGSNIPVPTPSLDRCRKDTDFGQGFYVTPDYYMAEKWACNKKTAVISEYWLDDEKLSAHTFQLNKEWLDFVISNRGQIPANFDPRTFDLLIGATADDRMFSTIEQYQDGLISSHVAIEVLNCMKIGTQICIRTETGLEYLYYLGISTPSPEKQQTVKRQSQEERKTVDDKIKEIIRRNNQSDRYEKALSFTTGISSPDDPDKKQFT